MRYSKKKRTNNTLNIVTMSMNKKIEGDFFGSVEDRRYILKFKRAGRDGWTVRRIINEGNQIGWMLYKFDELMAYTDMKAEGFKPIRVFNIINLETRIYDAENIEDVFHLFVKLTNIDFYNRRSRTPRVYAKSKEVQKKKYLL